MKTDPFLSAVLDLADEDPLLPEREDDALTKFLADAERTAAVGGQQHAHNLARDLAPQHARVEQHYKKLAKAAAEKNPPASASSLEKRASEVMRTEETRYPSGKILIAEIGADGSVLRVYEKQV
jgi:hypothetical protein